MNKKPHDKSPYTEYKKISIKKDGATQLDTGFAEEVDALISQTKYGYKVISLVPDVKKVYIEVTTLCNFDCRTCIRNSWEDKLDKMDYDLFQQIVKQLRELPDLECVHLGGFGEPLSHPRIMEMIQALKELNVRVEMITNGSLLTERVIDKLIAWQVDNLFVSIDGPDDNEYNDIRVGGDFTRVTANIETLNRIKAERKSVKPELAFEFVAMKRNFYRLPEVVKLATRLKARYVLVTNVMPYCEELKDQILYDLDDTKNLFNMGLLTLIAKMPHFKLRTERHCKFIGERALTITREGNIAPCYALMHSYQSFIYDREKKIKHYYLGNVRQSSIKEIWTNPDYAAFRSRVIDFEFPSCTDCKYLEGCNYPDDNEMDCWGNSPTCSDCLWARGIIVCP